MKPRIEIVTLFDESIRDYAEVFTGANRDYACRNGYAFHCFDGSLDASKATQYSKILAILERLITHESDYIIWIDADALITCDTPLETWIDEDFDIITGVDQSGCNTGTLILKVNNFVEKFLQHWKDAPVRTLPPFDQPQFQHLAFTPMFMQRVKLLGYEFSSHYTSRKPAFIKHFMGAPNDLRAAYARQHTNPNLSYSQYGEDLIVRDFFGGKTGRFLELGAMDGIKDSNCRKLAELGWTGVSVEPNPSVFARLAENYRLWPVSTVCALIAGHSGLRTLHLNDDGLSSSYEAVVSSAIKSVPEVFHNACLVGTVTPDQLCEVVGNDFDFVSLDVEGAELHILEAGGEMLARAMLLCIEHTLPFSEDNPAYTESIMDAAGCHGFTKLLARTSGNVLLSK